MGLVQLRHSRLAPLEEKEPMESVERRLPMSNGILEKSAHSQWRETGLSRKKTKP